MANLINVFFPPSLDPWGIDRVFLHLQSLRDQSAVPITGIRFPWYPQYTMVNLVDNHTAWADQIQSWCQTLGLSKLIALHAQTPEGHATPFGNTRQAGWPINRLGFGFANFAANLAAWQAALLQLKAIFTPGGVRFQFNEILTGDRPKVWNAIDEEYEFVAENFTALDAGFVAILNAARTTLGGVISGTAIASRPGEVEALNVVYPSGHAYDDVWVNTYAAPVSVASPSSSVAKGVLANYDVVMRHVAKLQADQGTNLSLNVGEAGVSDGELPSYADRLAVFRTLMARDSVFTGATDVAYFALNLYHATDPFNRYWM